jgi:hypothetical protein
VTDVGLSIGPKRGSPWSLELKLGASRFECNLELDHPDYAISSGSLNKVDTLDAWLDQLAELSIGRRPVALLPYDFADQCTAWLRIAHLPDGLVEVEAGWSLVSQHALEPKDLRAPEKRIHDFAPIVNARIVRPLADIIAAVAASREAIAEREVNEPWWRDRTL